MENRIFHENELVNNSEVPVKCNYCVESLNEAPEPGTSEIEAYIESQNGKIICINMGGNMSDAERAIVAEVYAQFPNNS